MQQFLKSFFLVFCLLCALTQANAARRPGVMRPLPFASPNGTTEANVSTMRGAWKVDAQGKKVSILFTREADGTRNLWQATPGEESEWDTKPLTRLSAPLWADNVQVSQDGRTVLCLTNAVGDQKTAQVARLDERNGRLEALTRDDISLSSLAISPDGKYVAYARENGNSSTIFLLSLADRLLPAVPRRVIEGRRPAWLDSSTLLFCDTQKNGLYRLSIPTDWPPLQNLKTKPQGIAWRGGESTATPDGSQLCLALDADRYGNAGRLFFMASNGSGERALRNTDDAHAPRFAPDGTALLFDAPLAPNGPRRLWVMNLAPIVPTVEMTYVVAEKAAITIVGTVFCEDSPDIAVKLEAGQGGAPEQWQTIAQPKAPRQKEPLARWQPPADATGEWSLRLTATSPDGDAAQTTMTIQLPLATGATITNTSPDVSLFVSPVGGAAGMFGTHGIGAEVIPGEWINGAFVPRGPKTFPERNHTTVTNPGLSNPEINQPAKAAPANPIVVPPVSPPVIPNVPNVTPHETPQNEPGSPFESLPLPALPPPPVRGTLPTTPPVQNVIPPAPTVNSTPPVNSTASGNENRVASPLKLDTPPVRQAASNSPSRLPPRILGGPVEKIPTFTPSKVTTSTPQLPVRNQAPRQASQMPKKTAPPKAEPVQQNTNSSALKVDLPESLTSGQEANVTVTLRNNGKTAWSSSGDNPARLLVRWFDENSGQRVRWELKWLPNDVAPGQSVPMSFSITTPRAGKLRLNFVVARLPNGKYQPASTQARDDFDKLAEKNVRVTVK